MMRSQTLIYVDAVGGGHHPEYLAFFIQICSSANVAMRAYVPEDVWRIAVDLAGARASECAQLIADVNLTAASLREKMAFLREIEVDANPKSSTAIFFGMLDPWVLPLALRAASGHKLKVAWSGIFFRDSFNYFRDELTRPHAFFKSLVKLVALRLGLRGSGGQLFTINRQWRSKQPAKMVWLPDVLSSLDRTASEAAKENWPVPISPHSAVGETRMLLYGALHPRKGIAPLLKGLLELRDDELHSVRLKLLGKFDGPTSYRETVVILADQLNRRGAMVEIVEGFVSTEDLDRCLRWTHIVLAPYLDHVGSSGVINVAAQYGRPLISQNTYQIGEEMRVYDLGIVLSVRDADAVTHALRKALKPGLDVSAGMQLYRTQRTPELAASIASHVIRLLFESAKARFRE